MQLVRPRFDGAGNQVSDLTSLGAVFLLCLALDHGAQISRHSNMKHVVGTLFHRITLGANHVLDATLSDSE
jgi:hypothetical protein